MIWKRLVASALAICLAASGVPTTVHSALEIEFDSTVFAQRGTCGENLTWYYNGADTLKISGRGPMDDYTLTTDIPWYSFTEGIHKVLIEDGVTGIGKGAFYECTICPGSQYRTLSQVSAFLHFNHVRH